MSRGCCFKCLWNIFCCGCCRKTSLQIIDESTRLLPKREATRILIVNQRYSLVTKMGKYQKMFKYKYKLIQSGYPKESTF